MVLCLYCSGSEVSSFVTISEGIRTSSFCYDSYDIDDCLNIVLSTTFVKMGMETFGVGLGTG